MKAKTLQVHWHEKLPVFSVDIEGGGGGRLATAGGDNTARVWRVDDQAGVRFLASLARHTSAVNVVRWAPRGRMLATASDDGSVMLWQQSLASIDNNASSARRTFNSNNNDDGDEEAWVALHLLRGPHMSDIYDLAWSPCSRFLATTSIDYSSRIWDVSSKKIIQTLSDHSHFVQGVAWDPFGSFLATQSSDRSVHIYNLKTAKNNTLTASLINKVAKMVFPDQQKEVPSTDENGAAKPVKPSRLYHDETLMSFFRRPAFSPDGSLLVTPTGIDRTESSSSSSDSSNHVIYIHTRNHFKSTPVAVLSGFKRPAIVIKFSPVIYELRPNFSSSTLQLPYRMIFAVGSQDAVTIYDTQQLAPLAQFANLHYSSITDLAWSSDGLTLILSSTDGFCSIVCFDSDELGVVYKGRTKLQEVNAAKSNSVQPSSSLTPTDTNQDAPAPLIQEDAPPVVDIAPQQVTVGQDGKKRITPMFLGNKTNG